MSDDPTTRGDEGAAPTRARADAGAAGGPLVEVEGYALSYADRERALEVRASDGRLCLRLVLAPEGPQVEVFGASLAVRAEREVRLVCQRLEVEAAEGLRLQSGGDLELSAAGELRSEGFSQHLVARRGDLRIDANDDVAVEGERILLNSSQVGER